MEDEKVERCPHCNAPKSQWEKRNHSQVYIEYDWYCTVCHKYIRMSSH